MSEQIIKNKRSYSIIQSDITKLKVADAIVNAANNDLKPGAGVCGAIFNAAGLGLIDECSKHITANGPLKVSEIFTSQSYNLKEQGIKYIIHVVGPIYDHNNPKKSELELEQAIKNVLTEAFDNLKLNSVAIPAISSGIYHYPKDKCAQVFKRTILKYIDTKQFSSQEKIILCNKDPYTCKIFEDVFGDPQQPFIDNYEQQLVEENRELKKANIKTQPQQQEQEQEQEGMSFFGCKCSII